MSVRIDPATAEEIVDWLRGPEWDGDATWEFYADAIADEIAQHFLGEGESDG